MIRPALRARCAAAVIVALSVGVVRAQTAGPAAPNGSPAARGGGAQTGAAQGVGAQGAANRTPGNPTGANPTGGSRGGGGAGGGGNNAGGNGGRVGGGGGNNAGGGGARPPQTPVVGGPLPGLTADQLARFRAGRALFIEEEEVADGVGLVFNDVSCAACHRAPAVGGGSQVFATRFGTRIAGRFDPLIRFGGPVLQTEGIIGLNGIEIPGEVIPRQATIVAHRKTTPLFGLGLVDAVPDAAFTALAASQTLLTPSTAGRVNRVQDLRTGQRVVGKFGWKAAGPNLLNFAGDAYKEEMGITTPGWIRDANGRLIDEENPPQGDVSLLAQNPAPNPNDADIDDVIAFADFMSLLAPPPRGPVTPAVTAGESVFRALGCADCHTPQLVTSPNSIAALSLKSFAPYSDFLLHDMGTLGDGIEQGLARGTEMRTAPLWGLRFQRSYLHDGRARTLDAAIEQHLGQGRFSAARFRELNATDRTALLAFLNSL